MGENIYRVPILLHSTVCVAMLRIVYQCSVVSYERSDTSQNRTLNKRAKYNITMYGKVLKLALCNQYASVPELCLISVFPKRTGKLFFCLFVF